MGIHVCRYRSEGGISWGVVKKDTVYHAGTYATLRKFLELGRAESFKVDTSGDGINVSNVELLGPITEPCSIVCQGLNYEDHREESGASSKSRPPFNLMFMKASSALCGPYDDIVRPEGVRLLDYELELGVVIGKEITEPLSINEENVGDYVAGIVISNDVSARDVQIPQQQWFKGKSFRTFCPTGPYLYLFDGDDIAMLMDIDIRLEVNGKVRQQANTSQLIYKPAETIAELSRIMDLHPGDLVLAGTPGGVAAKAPPAPIQRISRFILGEEKSMKAFVKGQLRNPNYLQNGDVIRLTMRSSDGRINLGVMETRVVQESRNKEV